MRQHRAEVLVSSTGQSFDWPSRLLRQSGLGAFGSSGVENSGDLTILAFWDACGFGTRPWCPCSRAQPCTDGKLASQSAGLTFYLLAFISMLIVINDHKNFLRVSLWFWINFVRTQSGNLTLLYRYRVWPCAPRARRGAHCSGVLAYQSGLGHACHSSAGHPVSAGQTPDPQ
jgi:hypothetical protein